MVKYGPTIENLNAIHVKAEGKKDGIYSFRGLEYRIRGGKFTHFAHGGKVMECAGNFNVEIGTYQGGYSQYGRNALKKL